MRRSTPPEEEARVRSFDGTILLARRAGEGERVPLLIAPAVGVGFEVWRGALVDVARERPVITWDMRGLLGSGPAASGRVDPPAHARDALAVADHFGVDSFYLATWSTGGRIALEIAHRYEARVEGLVLVCAGYGYSLRRVLRYQELAALLPVAAAIGKRFAGPAQALARRFVARPEVPGIIRQSGLVAGSADADAIAGLFRTASECDPGTLLSTFRAVAGDAAPALLPEIATHTLIIAGERDIITARRVLEDMAAAMPHAELEVYEGASHYLPLEFPGRLSIDLRHFLDDLHGAD